MHLGRVAGITAAALAAGYASVQAANEVIRRREDLDPEAIERPGSMFYLRGLGIHFVERGSGPALVLLHGYGGSIFSFRHQIGPLAEHHRVIALDLPGFGYSDRPTDLDLSHTAHVERLRELLDRMDVERAAVLGHAMGGAIAMRLAAMHPERVERLILVAGTVPDQQRGLPLFPLVRLLLPLPLAFLAWNERLLRRRLARLAYDPAVVTDEVWRGYTRPLRLRGTAAALMRMLADVRRDQPVAPAAVRTRTLLLWGEADTAAPLGVGHRLHAEMPDARLEVIPRAGHLLLEEQPAACNQALLRFLAAPATPAVAS